MIRYDATKTFQRQYHKLPRKIQTRFDLRLKLFISDQSNPQLELHPLKGKYKGYWSINITGDVRALFQWQGEKIALFTFIGTHSELYG